MAPGKLIEPLKNVRLLPWGFFADPWSPRPIDHLALGFHVDFHIDVSGVDVCVSQPVADHVDVVSRSQQMHAKLGSKLGSGLGI
jgi:hypothetical protein